MLSVVFFMRSKGSFKNYVDKILAFFDHLPPCVANKEFPNGPGFRYGNFFIPRVVKNHKMSPREEKAYLPRAVVSIPETNHLFGKKL